MKEHFQDSGVRKWAGDDLIELQSESLEALQGLVEPYAPCIIKGCDVTTVPGADDSEPTYKVSGGLVALRGVDAAGNGCVKIARVEEFTSEVMPVYLSLANKQTARAYGDGSSKVIANDYIAEHSAIASDDALELTDAGGKRLVDTLGVTQKLDRDGGEARDTMVGFTEAATRTELTTGSKLGVLFGLVKKWFSDLRALAFKDKVAKGDLTDELAEELDGKVDAVNGMGLSDNNFTNALKDKLDGVEPSANNYSLPVATADTLGGVKFCSPAMQAGSVLNPTIALARTYPVQKHSNGGMVVNVPWVNTTYGLANTSSSGLMSAEDKAKLDKLTGAIKVVAAGVCYFDAYGKPISGSGYSFGDWSVERKGKGYYHVKIDGYQWRTPYCLPFFFVGPQSSYTSYDIRCVGYSAGAGIFPVYLYKDGSTLFDGTFEFCILQIGE